MKALILAAGLGTRLAPITNDRPKALVPVNGIPILVKQINNLHECGVFDITIISGYKANMLEKLIHEKWKDINIVVSEHYELTNNMYSAYLGIKSMFPDMKILPFLMMNADVFFDVNVLRTLIEISAKNAIVVDIGRYLEESMKVIEKNGRLIEISKEIMQNESLGCSIDVYKFDAIGGHAFFDNCVEYIERRKEKKLWSEVALNDALKSVVFRACPLKGRWYEIDNLDDLAAAESIFVQ